MNNLTFLFAALAVLWTGVLGYVLRLSSLRRRLEERIDMLEERVVDRDLHDA